MLVCYKWPQTGSTSYTNLIFPVTFIKVCSLPIQNNMHCWWIETNFMIMLEICQKQPFDIIAMTPRGILGLCCVHILQLMIHTAIYTLSFTLQLCYKPLGILQRVTKSQKVHISSHDALQKFHNINFAWDRSRGSLWDGVEKQEFSPSPINSFENNQKPVSWNFGVDIPY